MTDEIRQFDAAIIGVGTSAGIIIPSHVMKYVGLQKGQKLKVKLELVEEKTDGRAGIRTYTLRITPTAEATV